MTSATIVRELHRPRVRRVALLAIAACLAAGAASGAVVAALDRDPPHIAAAPPVVVPAPLVVAPVHVTTPEPPPPPAPEPEPEPAPLPPPRATTPLINPECSFVIEGDRTPPFCTWDPGFPAISADGKRVATQVVDADPSGEGPPSVTIRLVDVRTRKVLRELPIVVRDGYDWNADEITNRRRLLPATRRRAAAAQRILDAGGYRSMDFLGARTLTTDDTDIDRTRVHADIEGELVRAIDPATGRVLWQGRFHVPRPHRADPDEDCSGFSLAQTHVWWDPATRVVLVNQLYHHGGCMCGETVVDLVRRV